MERVEVALDAELAGDLAQYAREEHVTEDAAAERLLADALEQWRRDRAVERFSNGELAFAAAAELAELDPWTFADLLRERGVTWVDSDRVAAELDG